MTCDQASFERDVAKHEMQVIRDEGVNRHLMFRQPGESAYWFEILTWPGTLCIKGDMGTYVFSRLSDMFQFFRTDDRGDPSRLYINKGYWAEKLQAVDCNGHGRGSAETFSADRYKRRVIERFRDYCRDQEVAAEERLRIWEALREDVLEPAVEFDSTRAFDALMTFRDDGHPRLFEDCWEWNFNEYTFHFIWNLYAIAWAIRQFDAACAPAAEIA